MAAGKLNRLWTLVTIFLVIVIAIGGIVIWSKYSPYQPLEISISPAQEQSGEIYIGGAVNKPGFYPLLTSDTINALIQAAGGTVSSANLSGLELYIPGAGVGQGEQKININRAEVWLLEALPGIGKTLAQRIIDYRQKNGLFNNVDELLKVPGIGTTTYARFKSLITVADR
ncbi:MAG: ComEA family DNA-binding protein [Chloroflexota bacterium]